jgi:hypothetical protein
MAQSGHPAALSRCLLLGEFARQRGIVAELAKDHHDVRFARELLALFETTQALHIADRDRIRAELAAM